MTAQRFAGLTIFAAVILAIVVHAPAAPNTSGKTIELFNGKNLDGFDTFLREQGLNNDPHKVFQVHGGMIHVSGTEYGYFITKEEYENYRLTVEFKWGEKTHPPRKDRARDSGILFHVVGPQQVWPKSIEYQMIEGGTGDVILVGDGTSLTRDGETRTRGVDKRTRFDRYGKGPWKDIAGYRDPNGEPENPLGEWNLMELLADGDSIEYRLNGKLVNKGTKARPSKGKILFQSEGAELYFRNIKLTALAK